MKFSWSDDTTPAPLKLVITSQDNQFDPVTLHNWQAEGFSVTYLPFTGTRREYERQLHHLADPLELGENYAIIGRYDIPAIIARVLKARQWC